MSRSLELTGMEISCLEMISNGKFINIASAPKDIEELVLKGYVSKSSLVVMPMMPARYDYALTVTGMTLLRQYRPQYD